MFPLKAGAPRVLGRAPKEWFIVIGNMRGAKRCTGAREKNGRWRKAMGSVSMGLPSYP